eukprot:m.163741 g.163741  ORF g.163741 m.163741 type:complete len:53 (-) comp15217_c1_seq6:550-708(-)
MWTISLLARLAPPAVRLVCFSFAHFLKYGDAEACLGGARAGAAGLRRENPLQ